MQKNFKLTAWLFLGILFLPGLVFLIEYCFYPKSEALSKQRIKIRFQHFYENDFSLKKYFITLNNYLNLNYLNVNEMNGVHIGKDGWLFLKPAGLENPIELLKGKNTITKIEINNISQFFKKRPFDTSIPYFFTIAPNKHSLYLDKIRTLFPLESYQNSARAIEIFSPIIKTILGESFIDILSDFEKLKINEPNLYQKLDTHWNGFASYFAYKKIMDRFSQVLNLKNLKRSEQAKVSRESTDEGDLLSMIRRGTLVDFSSMFTAYERQVIQIGAKNDNCIEHIDSSAKTEAVRSLVIIDCKSGRDILFIFGDSFMSYNWIQLFPHHFRRTIFSTNISSFDSLVKKYGKPDIILHERVERGVRFLKLK